MSESRNTGIVRREFFETLGLGALGVGAVAAAARQVIAAEGPQPKWEQTSDRKVRIGVVGGGFGCGFQWHNHPNCVVEAVSDLQPERCKRLMGSIVARKSYESLEKLVLDPKIEAVAVFTDAPSHGRHCVDVMNHGKHAFAPCRPRSRSKTSRNSRRPRRRPACGIGWPNRAAIMQTVQHEADLGARRIRPDHLLRGRILSLQRRHGLGLQGVAQRLAPCLPHACDGLLHRRHGKRYTAVSCLGYRARPSDTRRTPTTTRSPTRRLSS